MEKIKEEIIKIFNDFRAEYDFERHDRVWKKQSEEFRKFWREKIMDDNYPVLLEEDMDYVIRFFDQNARGAREFREGGGEHAAKAGIWQGMWYRALKDIKEKSDIKKILDKIFNTEDGERRIDLVDELEKINQKNKNGLTGKSAIILNALLFTYSPDKYLCMLSVVNHRFPLIDFFELGNSKQYKTYGEQVIKTNDDIISGFKEKYNINISPRALSTFIYEQLDGYYQWKNIVVGKNIERDDEEESVQEKTVNRSFCADENSFALEKHLEDFLVANWEATELGKLYDLIEEDGDIVSQQFSTDIGNIDLLVKEKESGNYVVIELKKGQTSDQTVGQLTRYMGWVKENKSKEKKVKGIIIAGSQDDRLRYAIQMVPDTEIFLYRINFILERPIK